MVNTTNNTITCPVDFVQMNERKARMTAAFVVVLAAGYLLSQQWIIAGFLVVDFLLRSFNLGRYSLLAFLSDQLLRLFAIKPKLTDQAPKRFAARIGLACSLVLFTAHLFHFQTLALGIAGILVVFALLESCLGFCAGCHAYTLYRKFIKN